MDFQWSNADKDGFNSPELILDWFFAFIINSVLDLTPGYLSSHYGNICHIRFEIIIWNFDNSI